VTPETAADIVAMYELGIIAIALLVFVAFGILYLIRGVDNDG